VGSVANMINDRDDQEIPEESGDRDSISNELFHGSISLRSVAVRPGVASGRPSVYSVCGFAIYRLQLRIRSGPMPPFRTSGTRLRKPSRVSLSFRVRISENPRLGCSPLRSSTEHLSLYCGFMRPRFPYCESRGVRTGIPIPR
jgi:hypothetical protein